MASQMLSAPNLPKLTNQELHKLVEDDAATCNSSGSRTPAGQFIETVYEVVSLVRQTLGRISTPRAQEVASIADTLHTKCAGEMHPDQHSLCIYLLPQQCHLTVKNVLESNRICMLVCSK